MARGDVDLDEYRRHRDHLSEAELFQAHGVQLTPDPETVRRRLIDALEAETAPRTDRLDTSSPADVARDEAVSR